MRKVPETNRFYVSNASDMVPNIQYTKSIDMDEVGYLRLSPPFPKLVGDSENADIGPVFADVISYGDVGDGSDTYKLITSDGIFDVDIGALTIALDAGAPAGNSDSRFVGWKGGDWYTNTGGDIYSLQFPAGTTWDIENTDTVDYAEVFVNRNTLVGINGSTLQQYLTTDMDGGTPPSTNTGPTLTVPSNFELRGLAYSNYRIGVGSYNQTGGNAYFFVWDGATTEANQGIPVYSSIILNVLAHKNSWAVLTSTGQLLYFNGGGFDSLGNLPVYYTKANWIRPLSYSMGRNMFSDGDNVYFNIGTLVESGEDTSGIVQGFYSGIWCHDANITGVYHRYGLSNSKIFRANLTASSGTFTSTAHTLETGDRVHLASGVTYFAISVTANTFKLADTYDLAVLGTATSTTADGVLTWVKREDWAQLTSSNLFSGACSRIDNYTALTNTSVFPFFAGAVIATKAMASESIVCVMAPAFDNIGGVTYSKMKSDAIEETWQTIVVKHKKLYENDKIVIKAKTRDVYRPIGIGEAGDLSSDVFITWVTSTSFTTTKDLTDVRVGDEVEFLSGAGAGATAHIASAPTNVGGTWTVTLDEAVRGGASGNKSTCVIDSFVKIDTITKSNQTSDNVYTARVNDKSKWIQVKLELRGKDVVIEEMEVISIPKR